MAVGNISLRWRGDGWLGRFDAIGPQALIMLASGLIALVLFATRAPLPFSIDEVIYSHMAASMWEHGTLHIDPAALPAASPPPQLMLTQAVDGHVFPEYPSGYAVIAAPFYGLLGVHGLILLNVLAFIATMGLTFRVGRNMYGRDTEALIATIGLMGTSFLTSYVGVIWPHMLALALIMGACERLTSHMRTAGGPTLRNLVLAGLLIGLSVTVRVEPLIVVAALTIWLTLFGAPSQRLAPSAFLLGTAPSLLVAAALNFAKFGVFSPVSYGREAGAASLGMYVPVLVFLCVLVIAGSLIDPGRGRAAALIAAVRARIASLSVLQRWAAGGAVALAIVAVPSVAALISNMYVLVADLQMMDTDRASGAIRTDADGYLMFLHVHKKALLQSMPVLIIAFGTLFALFSGRHLAQRTLSFAVAGALIVFYSLSQWDGGFSYNMRYFLVCLPFLSLLAADYVVRSLEGRWETGDWAAARWGVIACAAGFVVAVGAGLPAGLYKLYGPLLVAGGLLALVIAFALRPQLARTLRSAWVGLVTAALGIGVMHSVGDLIGQTRFVNERADKIAYTASVLPEDALVLTTVEELFFSASLDEVTVANPLRFAKGHETASTLVAAFRAEGRCVYVHMPEIGAFDGFLARLGGEWHEQRLPHGAGAMAQLTDQGPRCALSGALTPAE